MPIPNLFALLRHHVRDGPCRVYMADMKVHVETSTAFFYPDVVVTCDERDRQLSELKEYVIIDPDMISIDCFRRDRANHWVLYPFTAAEKVVELASIDFSTSMDAIYEDVIFEEKLAGGG